MRSSKLLFCIFNVLVGGCSAMVHHNTFGNSLCYDLKSDIKYVEDHIDEELLATNEFIMTVPNSNGANALTAAILAEHLQAAVRFSQTSVSYEGVTYLYDDVCENSIPYVLQVVSHPHCFAAAA